MKEKILTLFQDWLFEECTDTVHTSDQHSEAQTDEEYQRMFLEFTKEVLEE